MARETTEDATVADRPPESDESASPEGEATGDGTRASRDEAPATESAAGAVDPTGEGPILLFDGVCNLCTGAVQFLIPRDPEGVLTFASLQSDAGQALLERFDLPTDAHETVVLVEGDQYYTRSAAALRVAKHLGRPYSWLYPFRYVPRVLRDGVYRLVARYRYRIFGQKDRCMVPPEDVESRFLE